MGRGEGREREIERGREGMTKNGVLRGIVFFYID